MVRLFTPDNPVIQLLSRVCDLILLSILFSLSCVLVVPAGAAITALYIMTMKMVRNEEGTIVKGYLAALRSSFFYTIPGGAFLLLDAALFFLIVYALFAGILLFSPYLFILLCIAALLLTAWLSWLFPLMARFENRLSRHYRNAAVLSVTQLPITFFMTLVNLLPLLTLLLLPDRTAELIAFWVLIGSGSGAFANSFYLRRVFDLFEEVPTQNHLKNKEENMETQLCYDGYTLVFQDDFCGPSLNRGDWNVELHDPGWVNEEWQRYVDEEENIAVQDGKLLLRAVKRKGEDESDAYTSGRINTRGKHEFTYGIFEARLKVPAGKGFLPAFWLLADEDIYGEWPYCGEIDIMEVLGQNTASTYGTIHYGLPHEQNQGILTLKQGDFSLEYHDFALKWEPGRLRWYVDGILFHEAQDWYCAGEGEERRPFPEPFDHNMYIILNLAVGGEWVGYPDETVDFANAALSVDYVKVYQKE